MISFLIAASLCLLPLAQDHPLTTTSPANPSTPASPPSADTELGERIVAFARQQLGKPVGDGQCTGLAIAALQHAHARAFTVDDQNQPVWGTFVASFKDARPGDILQFENVVFHSRKRTRRNGRPFLETSTTTFGHHTAIIEEVRQGGRVLVILHQNAGLQNASQEVRQVVQRDTLRLADRRPGGSILAYRPIPATSPPNSPSTPPRRNP